MYVGDVMITYYLFIYRRRSYTLSCTRSLITWKDMSIQ
eukprot:SAG25_NODE_309_length_10042_cov_25.194609_8_plen_38_part_00